MVENGDNDPLSKIGFYLSEDTYLRLISLKIGLEFELRKSWTWNDFFCYFTEVFNLLPSEGIFPEEHIVKFRNYLKRKKKKISKKIRETMYRGNFVFAFEDKYISLNRKGNRIQRPKSIL